MPCLGRILAILNIQSSLSTAIFISFTSWAPATWLHYHFCSHSEFEIGVVDDGIKFPPCRPSNVCSVHGTSFLRGRVRHSTSDSRSQIIQLNSKTSRMLRRKAVSQYHAIYNTDTKLGARKQQQQYNWQPHQRSMRKQKRTKQRTRPRSLHQVPRSGYNIRRWSTWWNSPRYAKLQ